MYHEPDGGLRRLGGWLRHAAPRGHITKAAGGRSDPAHSRRVAMVGMRIQRCHECLADQEDDVCPRQVPSALPSRPERMNSRKILIGGSTRVVGVRSRIALPSIKHFWYQVTDGGG